MVFRMIMLPWMLQSHLFPNIAILMASVVQVLERGQESPETSSEPLAIKTKVLGMINRVLTRGGYDLSDVLRSIINLVMIEVSFSLCGHCDFLPITTATGVGSCPLTSGWSSFSGSGAPTRVACGLTSGASENWSITTAGRNL